MAEESYDRIAKKVMQQIRQDHNFLATLSPPRVKQRGRYPVGGSGIKMYRGKPDADIAKGSSGTVSRYDPNTDTDTTKNDEVLFVINSGTSGKWVYYCRLGDHFEAISGEC